MNKYDLYTLCVQDPPRYVRFLAAIHGRSPTVFRDDFAGAGNVALAWAKSSSKRRAIAVESETEEIPTRPHPRLRHVAGDVRATSARADVIASLNFGICELHTHRELLAYMGNALRTLKARGVLVCDMYGGATAYRRTSWTQEFAAPRGGRVFYTWEQVDADPLTARVYNCMHFEVRDAKGKTTTHLDEAFEYRWRLWTIPEIRDAMTEAGFKGIDVYDRIGSALDSRGNMLVAPVQPGEKLDRNWVVYVAGRK